MRILRSLAFTAWLISAGCSSNASSDSVRGKVTLNDKPVSGMVVFTATDGKTASSPIGPDGSYTVTSPPRGTVKVSVTGMGPAAGRGPAPAKMKDDSLPELPAEGVPPPAKYAKPDNGLTFDVTGGPQSFDISLQP